MEASAIVRGKLRGGFCDGRGRFSDGLYDHRLCNGRLYRRRAAVRRLRS